MLHITSRKRIEIERWFLYSIVFIIQTFAQNLEFGKLHRNAWKGRSQYKVLSIIACVNNIRTHQLLYIAKYMKDSNKGEESMKMWHRFCSTSSLLWLCAAVPMKSSQIIKSNVNPLIYQFYKSLACFLTSWLVLIYTVCSLYLDLI